MGLIRLTMIFAILGTMFLGIAAVNAQVNAELPQFKSGASVMMGVPVDFNILNQRVGAIYYVLESDDSHIVWKLTGTTGDWAFVFSDGRIIVTSTVDFNLDAKDTLTKELNDVMDMLNLVNAGISSEARSNAIDLAVYYASERDIYHKIKYSFQNNLDLTLVVPDCAIQNARISISGLDCHYCGRDYGQFYSIDGNEIASCKTGSCAGACVPGTSMCNVNPVVDISDKIPTGLHEIKADFIDNPHVMIIEALTSPTPPRKFVLYGPEFKPWINETGSSMTLNDMNSLIAGKMINTTA